MEGFSMSPYNGFNGSLKKKGYVRLNGPTGRRRRMRQAEMGSTGGKRRRFWRIKVKSKLRILSAPKRFFIWLRDAYVKMMMGLANSSAISAGYGGAISDGISTFGRRPPKEYDEKVIIEIYKSLALTQGMVQRDTTKLGSAIVRQR